MGTSSARRGPTTRVWRSAKGAATRYLSPGAGAEVSAREVVARYLAAIAEVPGRGEALAAFRVTRKVAQDLGALWQEAAARGWDLALQDRGLAPLARESADVLAPGLSGVLAGSGGGLEDAVVRTALALVIGPAVKSPNRPEPAQVVRQFLVTALHLRLALDLGEPLEAAAGSAGRLQEGLSRIKAVIEAGAGALDAMPEPPSTPGLWQGFTGWSWVTEVMAGLMGNLEPGDPPGRPYGSGR
jgi:hypothetical protein